ncbi:hypothetical protein COCNU_08G001540 [Cocos nucifera]|uniref:Uncharacterized protein n=1 Tax=Cocos nucifera TaxID=13894 RepID=A0A8K0N5C0_COCNU|nr:hypothetical protein COCNU_08G001540 [Cocos nucifera]
MAENGNSSPAAATVAVAEKKVEDKRSWADEEETAPPPPPTATSISSSGVEAETAELKKIEELTISEEKETSSRLVDPDKSEIKAFLEVTCMCSGKVRRFADGTEAGFALHLINRKLGIGFPAALYIEAVKEGEEPVSFGPNAVLVNYGKDWKLQTVTNEGYEEATQMQQQTSKSFPEKMKSSDLRSRKKTDSDIRPAINFQYIGKILVAFAFIFLLGEHKPTTELV